MKVKRSHTPPQPTLTLLPPTSLLPRVDPSPDSQLRDNCLTRFEPGSLIGMVTRELVGEPEEVILGKAGCRKEKGYGMI